MLDLSRLALALQLLPLDERGMSPLSNAAGAETTDGREASACQAAAPIHWIHALWQGRGELLS